MRARFIAFGIFLAVLAVAGPAMPQNSGRMDNDRLDKVIRGLDGISGDIESEPGFWLFKYQGRQVYVVVNPVNNQLQILAPIIPVDSLNHATLVRTLEANFSATNEARYAVAKGLLWSVYANSIANLVETEFIQSLKQVASTASKFPDLIVLDETKPDGSEGSKSNGVEVIKPDDNVTEDGKS